MSDKPSAEGMEAAENWWSSKYDARVEDVAALLDTFAAQAVAVAIPHHKGVVAANMCLVKANQRLVKERDQLRKGTPEAQTEAAIQLLWLSDKPSHEAQQIRSEIGHLFEGVPDYVWDLLDIAAERGIKLGKKDAKT